MQTVNRAFSQYHTALMTLRKTVRDESSRDAIGSADDQLKTIRENAVKAIHDTRTCSDDKDENTSQEQSEQTETDSDHKSSNGSLLDLVSRLFGRENVTVTVVTASASPSAAVASASPAPSGTAQQIADDAVAAMKLVYDTTVASLPSPAPTATHRSGRPEATEHGKSRDHRGSDSKDGD